MCSALSLCRVRGVIVTVMIVAPPVPPCREEGTKPCSNYGDVGGCHVAYADEQYCGGQNAEKADQVVHAGSLRRERP